MTTIKNTRINNFLSFLLSLPIALLIASSLDAGTLSRSEMVKQAGIETVCSIQDYMKCLNITEAVCKSAVDKCIKEFPLSVNEEDLDTYYDRFDQCMDQELSINNDLMDYCETALNEESYDYTADDPYSESGMGGPVVIAGHNEDAIKAIKSAGIPIYQTAKMITSIDEANAQQLATGDIKPLPTAIFATTDNYEDVVSYYKSQLKGFNFYQLDSTQVLFMRDGPEKFDMMQNFEDYFQKEHVLIEKIEGELFLAPPGTNAKIEIAYK
jgi:hypothetical protein